MDMKYFLADDGDDRRHHPRFLESIRFGNTQLTAKSRIRHGANLLRAILTFAKQWEISPRHIVLGTKNTFHQGSL